MTHGYTTTKTPTGYKWTITKTVWDDASQKAVTAVLKQGLSPTRARATGMAKRWVLFFRRGGQIAA